MLQDFQTQLLQKQQAVRSASTSSGSRPTPKSASSPPASNRQGLPSPSSFEDYYRQQMDHTLAEFERQRQEIRRYRIKSGLVIFAIASVGLIFANLTSLIIGVGLWVGLNGFIKQYYSKTFKTEIIQNIVDFLSPTGNLRFFVVPLDFSTLDAFNNSQLFSADPNLFIQEEDCVIGLLGNTEIYFSEVQARQPSKAGQRVFQGLFFRAVFNKQFKHSTFVLPDRFDRLIGKVNQLLQPTAIRQSQPIKLEDPEFERLFEVYGDDQVESRYILSTSLMQRLKEFRNKVNRELYLSFASHHIYVAIPFEENLFEPNMKASVRSLPVIKAYADTLQLMIGIVDDLNLNRRIWT